METPIVYMLRCADGTLYTGWTVNLQRRLVQHNRGIASKYTRARLPVVVVYQEPADSRRQALQRERAIKKLSRQAKEALLLHHGPMRLRNSAKRSVGT